MGATLSVLAICTVFTAISLLTVTLNIGGINDDEE